MVSALALVALNMSEMVVLRLRPLVLVESVPALPSREVVASCVVVSRRGNPPALGLVFGLVSPAYERCGRTVRRLVRLRSMVRGRTSIPLRRLSAMMALREDESGATRGPGSMSARLRLPGVLAGWSCKRVDGDCGIRYDGLSP